MYHICFTFMNTYILSGYLKNDTTKPRVSLCPVSLLMLWAFQLHHLGTSLLVLVLGKCHRPTTHSFTKPNPVLKQNLCTVGGSLMRLLSK